MTHFEEKLALGRNYEKALADWLKSRGWYVLPVYDYSGGEDDEKKAPKLGASTQTSIVMPDLLVARGGRAILLEAKFKTEATRRTINCWSCKKRIPPDDRRLRCDCGAALVETGFSRRLFYHYGLAAIESGIETWAAFVHLQEQEVRAAPFWVLEECVRFYRGSNMGKHGMAFFPWDKLQPLGRFSEIIPITKEAA